MEEADVHSRTSGEDPHPAREEPGRTGQRVSEETNILDDLKVNSARLVDVVLAFEDEFDIEIDDDEVDSVNSVGDCVRPRHREGELSALPAKVLS